MNKVKYGFLCTWKTAVPTLSPTKRQTLKTMRGVSKNYKRNHEEIKNLSQNGTTEG